MLYMIFEYGWEPVVIHWRLIGFLAILEIYLGAQRVSVEYNRRSRENFWSGPSQRFYWCLSSSSGLRSVASI